MRLWIENALKSRAKETELSLRIVDRAEIQALNAQYRGKDTATNVLSFPTDLPAELELPLLGDIIVCAEVVEREATEQNKSLNDHWAHMLIHGCLHLQGYDHIDDDEAEIMEGLETRLLAELSIVDPYSTTSYTQ
ncbi:MAG: putative rRNA maturation factor [Flavobacteriales bacterium]|jgi:probable rRNA maturation factor